MKPRDSRRFFYIISQIFSLLHQKKKKFDSINPGLHSLDRGTQALHVEFMITTPKHVPLCTGWLVCTFVQIANHYFFSLFSKKKPLESHKDDWKERQREKACSVASLPPRYHSDTTAFLPHSDSKARRFKLFARKVILS